MSVQNPVPLLALAERVAKCGGVDALQRENRYLVVFPLLEYPFPRGLNEFKALLVESEGLNWTSVVNSALREDSVYWVVLALKWIESGFLRNVEIENSIKYAMTNDRLDQAVRHKAYKLYYRKNEN